MKKGYRRLSAKESLTIVNYFPVLSKVTLFLKENIIGKYIYIMTDESCITLTFSESNFMHLCGLDYKGGSNKFFNACLNEKLEINNIKVKTDGTSFQKLRVINQIEDIFKMPSQIASSGTFLNLRFDSAIRTKKQIAAITLLNDRTTYVPQSLLNLKNMKKFPSSRNVICIYAEDMDDKNINILFIDREWSIQKEKECVKTPKIDKKNKMIHIYETI